MDLVLNYRSWQVNVSLPPPHPLRNAYFSQFSIRTYFRHTKNINGDILKWQPSTWSPPICANNQHFAHFKVSCITCVHGKSIQIRNLEKHALQSVTFTCECVCVWVYIYVVFSASLPSLSISLFTILCENTTSMCAYVCEYVLCKFAGVPNTIFHRLNRMGFSQPQR